MKIELFDSEGKQILPISLKKAKKLVKKEKVKPISKQPPRMKLIEDTAFTKVSRKAYLFSKKYSRKQILTVLAIALGSAALIAGAVAFVLHQVNKPDEPEAMLPTGDDEIVITDTSTTTKATTTITTVPTSSTTSTTTESSTTESATRSSTRYRSTIRRITRNNTVENTTRYRTTTERDDSGNSADDNYQYNSPYAENDNTQPATGNSSSESRTTRRPTQSTTSNGLPVLEGDDSLPSPNEEDELPSLD